MSKIFTSYPQTSEIPFEAVNASEAQKDKKIRKLQKRLKKQKKLICKLSKQVISENSDSQKHNINIDNKFEFEPYKKKSFFSKVKDRLVEALPSICRTVAKTATTIICGWAFKSLKKLKVA